MKCFLSLLFAAAAIAQTYRVETPAGIVEMSSEQYVAGVVAGESSVFRSGEALRAMAIVCRTYAARLRGRHAKEGFDFCSTTHCQRFVAASARSAKAAQETAGKILWFNGKPAYSVYSRSCGGKTEAVSAVWLDLEAPYLMSHADPYCSSAWTWSPAPDQIASALRKAGLKVPASLQSINVVRRTESGRAKTLSLNGELVSASAFRFAMGRFIGWSTVRSDLYSIDGNVFHGSGEGHGVGLCQLGADQMGQQGKSYAEILAFYYPGTSLRSRDFNWIRLAGEGVTLFTLLPDSDRFIIATAENLRKRWQRRLPWPLPNVLEIYAYPDLDAFRNATGEPGWVAARTVGNRIELQPLPLLRRRHALTDTLEHEVIHTAVESAAHPGLPVWFREGLVEHLSASHSASSQDKLDESAIRQRVDEGAARAGYDVAQSRVRDLVNRYGEPTVLSWVSRGLPVEVKNSTPKNPPVNNR